MRHNNSGSIQIKEKGVALVLATMSLIFLVPLLGLTIDVGVLYVVRVRLQSSVDGATLAAARALTLGSTTTAQAASAKQNAVNWFYANFPAGNWSTSNTVMDTSNVQVFDDPVNPSLRNVTVAASTTVPTYFMKWFNLASTTVSATGNASRRDVVIMMVIDRSGSMGTACSSLITAAKTFTGQFAQGRDRIGMISFGDNAYLHSVPTTNFQTTLGYTNNLGSGTGEIDSVACAGGTNMSQAISMGYNELYKVNLPGALNLIMFETDGRPNFLTLNFYDAAASPKAGLTAANCTDLNGKNTGNGGFNSLAALPTWTSGHTMGPGGFMTDIPAGIIGAMGVADSGSTFFSMYKPWTTTKSNTFQENSGQYITSGNAPGCNFTGNHSSTSDYSWLPLTDVYGNDLINGSYKSVPTAGSPAHITSLTAGNVRNAAFNASDSAAYRARTNATLPVYFFGIGLGGTSATPPDYVLMQRMTNDPNGDNFNSPAKYVSCANATNCVTYTSQPQGTFIFSSDTSDLAQAYLSISSQILRLSK